ncbi:DUF2510 domain-containing protein [Rathayibacter iranicus]|uniref:DUF2510 domain-containing protein n=2 Tax=Rathayibacter iranicus TaxID=59737 RepID=A0AAD1ELF5_9MICO|nr:DUF2510 domain-containing protein [Rathayibacter iranicus]AZZ55062.1 DUF2510 domain-containing protein [Rathayibacter iranicus]MWV32215.1 DUF2510 domain-containing protein [Rathayibacter iranicus NCPPB 2253 = VKM Ac-1602]PPI50305.1 hypothetical protein C5E09_02645 [Rathayibacter iranicus]PPI61970.1 hypothetical protein C5E08_03555 [Rathayibacter iranicus]PPI73577.1 hypothetical protein C5E01_02625 [Rathayibacter iranicus]
MPDDSVFIPPPGWYPHPADVGSELYWDGAAWTDRSRPSSPTPMPADGTPEATVEQELYAYPSAPSSSASRNPMAVASLVLGIISLLINPLLVPSILAIVFAARGRAAAAIVGGGRGLATAGLVIGILGLVSGVVNFVSNIFSELSG